MSLQAVRMILLSSLSLSKRKRKSKYWVHPILRYREEGEFISLSRSDLKQAPEVYVMSGWRWTWRRTDVTFWLKMRIGLTSIFDVALTLDLVTQQSQRQLTSVLGVNLTLTLDVEFTLNFGHPTLQPKFDQISTSNDVVCLFCACWDYFRMPGAQFDAPLAI